MRPEPALRSQEQTVTMSSAEGSKVGDSWPRGVLSYLLTARGLFPPEAADLGGFHMLLDCFSQ